MIRRITGRRFRGVAGLAFLLFAFLPASSPVGAATVDLCTDPPRIMPVGNLEPGMMGKGWTVIKGTEPVSFDVEILGVMQDGIAPDVDLILVEASGSAIDQTGGIAYGFSGSPVYINGKLVGSVSYKFWGDANLGGLTPAKPMVDILQYPTSYGKTAAATLRSAPGRITVPDRLRARISDRLGVATSEVSSTISRLKLPVGVSGVSDDVLAKEQKRFDRMGMDFVMYKGGSAAKPTATSDVPLAPGDSAGVINSYGDITYGAFGTVTAVCGDMVVMFGHIYDHLGQTRQLGLNDAPVVTTVADEFFGDSYKIAVPGELHGVVDQDRWTGVRGIEGLVPSTVPVTSDMTSLDTGKRLPMETWIVSKGSWIRWITWDHIATDVHLTLDAHNGTVDMAWTITGTFEGEPFQLALSDKFASGYVLYQAAYAPYSTLRILQNSGFKPKITGVDATATVTQDVIRATIRRPFTASSVEPTMEKRRRLQVKPGDTIKVRVPLMPSDGSGLINVEFTIDVPGTARGDGEIRIDDGNPPYRIKADTFQQLLNRLERADHNTDLVVKFKVGGVAKTLKLNFPQDYVLGGESHRVRIEVVR